MPRADRTRHSGKIAEGIRFRVLVEQMQEEAQRLVSDHDALRERMVEARKDLVACLTSLRNGANPDEKTLRLLAQTAESLGHAHPRVNRIGWDIAEHSRKVSLLQDGLVRIGERFRK